MTPGSPVFYAARTGGRLYAETARPLRDARPDVARLRITVDHILGMRGDFLTVPAERVTPRTRGRHALPGRIRTRLRRGHAPGHPRVAL